MPSDQVDLDDLDRKIAAADIAAAERVLVERGLGDRYGLALSEELGSPHGPAGCSYGAVAKIRTAPLEICLRAMARVVREHQPKET